MKALPPAVLDSLRTWSNKRERITVYASAALFEFASSAPNDNVTVHRYPPERADWQRRAELDRTFG